jgi:hypothetical protein
MGKVEFTDNYQDLSTQNGYQFKFYCQSCGNGYMSTFKTSATGVAESVLRGAGSLLGGIFGRAANATYQIQELVGGPAHDAALQEAVGEIKPQFTQCKRCGQWVCREICWNAERSLCTKCAPILQRELAAKQAEIAVEQAETKLRAADLTAGVDVTAAATVHCPKCGAEAKAGAKFCDECGSSLVQRTECPKCGAKLAAGAKFCAECGQKIG